MSDDLIIVAIQFLDENLIQIQYAEERDRSSAAAVQRSIIIDTEHLVEGEVESLLDVARELVDKGLLMIRNPPDVRPPRGSIDDTDEEAIDSRGER